MKTKQTIFAYIIASLLFAATVNSFAADPAQTYSGRLNGGQFFCAAVPVPTPIISGFWTVSIDPNTPAQVTLNVFYDGRHHLAFGYNALMLQSYSGGVYTFVGFGDSATATLNTNYSPARFSWRVELSGGCPPSHPYDSLIFLGVANRWRLGIRLGIIANNLSKAGWSWGCVATINPKGQAIFVADAHRDDGRRFIVRADDELTAFAELEREVLTVTFYLESIHANDGN